VTIDTTVPSSITSRGSFDYFNGIAMVSVKVLASIKQEMRNSRHADKELKQSLNDRRLQNYDLCNALINSCDNLSWSNKFQFVYRPYPHV